MWLGMNHTFGDATPLIFETMVFPEDDWGEIDMERYSTEAEAIKGHARMVAKWSEDREPE